jgi:serine/threonine protein kinase
MSYDGSLADWLQTQSGLLPLQRVASLVRKAADALQRVHDQQKVYQDVNPCNFLVHVQGAHDERVDLKLVDLDAPGHAALKFSRGYSANSLQAYMAPEQWMGQAGPATDQYALAVMAYELLTGIPPFQGPPAQLMELHLKVQPPAASSIHQRVSPAMDAVLQSALAKRPEDRFPSIAGFARALEQAIVRPESLVVSTAIDGNLRATLPISLTEAAMGTLRSITLPNGRRITVSVPKGAYDGQVVRLEGFGDPSPTTGQTGAVFLMLSVTPTETSMPTVMSKHTPSVPVVVSPQHTPPPSVPITPQPASPPSIPITPQTAQQPSAFATPAIGRIKTMTAGLYTTIVNLSPRGKALLLGSLVLLLILGSIGIFLVQSNSSVSIPYPPHSGSLALSDALRDNSKGYSWPDNTSVKGGTCQFSRGAYHVIMTQAGEFHSCIAGATEFSNFAYEVRMTILQGDGGGVIFRANGTEGRYYYFRVGRDGSYGLYLYTGAAGSHVQVLTSGRAPAIYTGLNVTNVLGVVARGNTIDIYVNHQRIDGVTNGTYDSGQVGVAAAAYNTGISEVVFSNVQVWTF